MARILYSGVNEHGQPSEVMLGCAIGDIIPHLGTTAPPGTLVCDGSEVSREVYHELFEEIGSLCGQGDGSTTFNLPDLRGKWMMGADAEHAAGEEVAEGLPNITGETVMRKMHESDNSDILDICGAGDGAFAFVNSEGHNFDRYIGYGNNVLDGYAGKRFVFNAQIANAIYGASQHVTPASVAVLPCIVYE